MPARKNHSKEHIARTPAVVKRVQDFCWLISVDLGQSLQKLASIIAVSGGANKRRIAEEDLRYKSYTLKIRQMLSEIAEDKPSACCLPRLPFWSSNSPDLNPLDYYVWSTTSMKEDYYYIVWKSHKQVSASQCDVIKDRYWDSIRRYEQRYITAWEHFRPRSSRANGGYIE